MNSNDFFVPQQEPIYENQPLPFDPGAETVKEPSVSTGEWSGGKEEGSFESVNLNGETQHQQTLAGMVRNSAFDQ